MAKTNKVNGCDNPECGFRRVVLYVIDERRSKIYGFCSMSCIVNAFSLALEGRKQSMEMMNK